MQVRQPAGSVIRPAARHEVGDIVDVVIAAYEQYRPRVPAAIFDAYLEDMRRLGERWDEARVLVGLHQGRIAGTISFYADASLEGLGLPQGWAGFRTLAVHPAARGRGLGRRLVEACVDSARGLGVPTMGIHTAAFMTAACRIYEAVGFRRCPEHDLRASEILGLGTGLDDIAVIAYRLDLGCPQPE